MQLLTGKVIVVNIFGKERSQKPNFAPEDTGKRSK